MTTQDLPTMVERYVAMWNQPSPEARAAAVRALWAQDGAHYVRDREYHGYSSLDERVAGSYQRNVAAGTHRFRARPGAQRLRDLVTFTWEMVRTDSGAVVATGFEVFVLDKEDRIRADYQFIVS